MTGRNQKVCRPPTSSLAPSWQICMAYAKFTFSSLSSSALCSHEEFTRPMLPLQHALCSVSIFNIFYLILQNILSWTDQVFLTRKFCNCLPGSLRSWELLYVPCTSWLSSVNNRSYKYNQMKSNGCFKWICYFKDSKHFIQSVLSHDEIMKLASNAPGSQMVRNVWLEVN